MFEVNKNSEINEKIAVADRGTSKISAASEAESRDDAMSLQPISEENTALILIAALNRNISIKTGRTLIAIAYTERIPRVVFI